MSKASKMYDCVGEVKSNTNVLRQIKVDTVFNIDTTCTAFMIELCGLPYSAPVARICNSVKRWQSRHISK